MKALVLAVSATSLLAAMPALGQEDTYSYTGNFTCGTASYAAEWRFTGPTERPEVRVFQQRTDQDRVTWYDLVQDRGAEGHGLYDENGNLYVALSGTGEQFKARWTDAAAPDRDCQPFEVTRAASARDRFDTLFALLETPAPTEEVVSLVRAATRFAPIVFALPELDQQAYMRRYDELRMAFWSTYRDTVEAELEALPLTTPQERAAYVARLSAALNGGLAALPGSDGQNEAYRLMVRAADRYAQSGEAVADAFFVGTAALCGRFAPLNQQYEWYNFNKLELAAGLPVDYWTRDTAEGALAALAKCDEVDADYAGDLTDDWPEIQERQTLVTAMLAEQQRLLAMPASVETFVTTNNLRPDSALTDQIRYGTNMMERFFDGPLAPLRAELLELAVAAIAAESLDYVPQDVHEQPGVVALCDGLTDVSNLDWEIQSELRDTCSDATQLAWDKQAVLATEAVAAAFADVAPESEAATAARDLCRTLGDDLPYEVSSTIWSACNDATHQLDLAESAARCDRAVSTSGADDALLSSTIAVQGDRPVDMRTLICAVAEQQGATSFGSSGFLFWSQPTVTFTPPNRDGLVFVLKSAEADGADWSLAVEDGATRDALSRMNGSAEGITACLLGRFGCPM